MKATATMIYTRDKNQTEKDKDKWREVECNKNKKALFEETRRHGEIGNVPTSKTTSSVTRMERFVYLSLVYLESKSVVN